jgi:hypothetical protein
MRSSPSGGTRRPSGLVRRCNLYNADAARFASPRGRPPPAAREPAPGAHGGGEPVFHGPCTGPPERVTANAEPGTRGTFRAEATHQVTPVTHGVRYPIATWFR